MNGQVRQQIYNYEIESLSKSFNRFFCKASAQRDIRTVTVQDLENTKEQPWHFRSFFNPGKSKLLLTL